MESIHKTVFLISDIMKSLKKLMRNLKAKSELWYQLIPLYLLFWQELDGRDEEEWSFRMLDETMRESEPDKSPGDTKGYLMYT